MKFVLGDLFEVPKEWSEVQGPSEGPLLGILGQSPESFVVFFP